MTVYTGLLNLSVSDAELAAVIEHEVARALAQHDREWMPQTLVQQIIIDAW